MGYLICNGNTLYRRDAKLVRTPIEISLNPDARAVYQVAGTYTTTSWPASGFIDQATYANTYAVGYACLQAYLQHGDRRQIWRAVNTSHDPETVWYQGSYATSAPTFQASLASSESYLQLAAYHFTIPASLHSLDVTGATVKFVNGGGVRCYQSPAFKSAQTIRLKGNYSFDSWYPPIVVTGELGHYQSLMSKPSDNVIDILADYDTMKGARDLWDFGSSDRDGGIPTMTSPATRQYAMGSMTINEVNANKNGFWIVPMITCQVSGPTNYNPYYVPSNNVGYWACVSMWGVSVKVELG